MMLLKTLSLLFFCFHFSQAGELINVSVGMVAEQAVTARQVWISSFYDRWSLGRKAGDPNLRIPKPEWKLEPKSEAFQQATSALMLEMMVAKEAENFSIAQAPQEVIETDVKEFFQSVSSSSEWKKLEVTPKEMQNFLERKIRAQNFLKFKTESTGVVVSDDEAKAYFDKNRFKFGNMPFIQFKDSIKDVLARQALEERLKDWFEVLRRKYRVRFLAQVSE